MNVATIPTTVISMLVVTTHMEISVVSAIQVMKGVALWETVQVSGAVHSSNCSNGVDSDEGIVSAYIVSIYHC